MKCLNYIRSDHLRCKKSCRYLIGIGGVFFTLLFAHIDNQYSKKSVLFMAQYVMDGIPFFMCMIFGIFAFSDSICEDIKTNYYRLAILRGDIKEYCNGRTATIFFSAFLSLIVGFLLFIFFLKLNFPWKAENDSVYRAMIRSGAFRTILKGEHYVLYYAAVGLKLGILAGNLALFSALLSLYVKNRLLVYSVPVISFYFLANATYQLPVSLWWMDLYKIYISSYNVWNNDTMSFIWALLIGGILFFSLRVLIFRRIKGELEHG